MQAIAQETIDSFDAHNAPELIRCKDCDNQECEGYNGYIVCGITGESHPPTWFCADGEPKEGAGS